MISVGSFISTALLLSSCGVSIKNERWYGDVGSQGAIYFETLSSTQGTLSKPEWDQMRVGMACTTTDTLSEIKKEIEKLCSVTRCNYEKVARVLGKFQAHLNKVKSQTLEEISQ